MEGKAAIWNTIHWLLCRIVLYHILKVINGSMKGHGTLNMAIILLVRHIQWGKASLGNMSWKDSCSYVISSTWFLSSRHTLLFQATTKTQIQRQTKLLAMSSTDNSKATSPPEKLVGKKRLRTARAWYDIILSCTWTAYTWAPPTHAIYLVSDLCKRKKIKCHFIPGQSCFNCQGYNVQCVFTEG